MPFPFKRDDPTLRILAVEIEGVLYGPVIRGGERVCEAQNPLEGEAHQLLPSVPRIQETPSGSPRKKT